MPLPSLNSELLNPRSDTLDSEAVFPNPHSAVSSRGVPDSPCPDPDTMARKQGKGKGKVIDLSIQLGPPLDGE